MAVEISEKAITIIKAMQAGAEGLCGKELAEVCGLAPRAVTGVVNGLVKKGLVERHDGNPKTIWLTDEGRAYHIPNGENTVEVKEAKPAGYDEWKAAQEVDDDEEFEPSDADLEAIEEGKDDLDVDEMMDDLLDYDKVDEDTQRIVDNIRQQEWEEF